MYFWIGFCIPLWYSNTCVYCRLYKSKSITCDDHLSCDYLACNYLQLHVKCYLRGLLYNKEVAALQKNLSSCPTSVPWDVEIRPCTSGSSNECQQRASRSTELQFLPSVTSISRSLFANSRALAKSFSSVVFLVRRSRQFGLTCRKAARCSEISSCYTFIGLHPRKRLT